MKSMKKFMKKTLAAVLMTIMVMGLVACGDKDEKESGNTAEAGKYSITVEVKDADGNVSSYTGKTDAEVLSEAIGDIDGVTLEGYESDYGFYITAVNGIVADYDADGAYWSIYVNGEDGMYGIDTQPVADGDTYTFAYEVYVAE